MEQPEHPVHKPSLFMHSLMGYLIGTTLGIPAVVAMSVRAGDFHEEAAFQVLVCIGAAGAMIGFEIAARRRKTFGGGGIVEEWKGFLGTLPFYGLAAIVLAGSLGVTVLGSLIALLVMGRTTPK